MVNNIGLKKGIMVKKQKSPRQRTMRYFGGRRKRHIDSPQNSFSLDSLIKIARRVVSSEIGEKETRIHYTKNEALRAATIRSVHSKEFNDLSREIVERNAQRYKLSEDDVVRLSRILEENT